MRTSLLILAAALAACSTAKLPVVTQEAPPVKPTPPTTIVVTGQLANATPGDSVWISYEYVGEPMGHRTKAVLNTTGEFQLNITDVHKPISGQYVGPGGFMTIFFAPGDSVQMTADRQHFRKTVTFSGKGSVVNNYLAQAQRRFDYNSDSLPSYRFADEAVEQYQTRVEKWRQQQLDLIATYNAKEPLPAAVLQDRQAIIDYQCGDFLLNYVAQLKRKTKQEPSLPTSYYAFLAKLPLQTYDGKPSWAPTEEWMYNLLHSYGEARLLPPSGLVPVGAAERLYAQATTDLGNTPARDVAVGFLIANQLRGPSINNPGPVLALVPLFKTQNRDSTAALSVRYALKATEYLRPGAVAPAFTLQDANGKRVSLQDFRGKVVYLDFWYSSCAPCIAEAPAAVKLKKKFLDRDVVFLYISIDQKADDWQKALARYPLTGPNSIHLLDPGGSNATTAYGIGGFPSYWIIGRDGKIRQGSAPRPSAGKETVIALEKALAQKP